MKKKKILVKVTETNTGQRRINVPTAIEKLKKDDAILFTETDKKVEMKKVDLK